MPFDFKKEYREFYMPGRQPQLVTVPPMNYAAVRGTGDPNEAGGAYQQALAVLYAVAYTIKMSYKGSRSIRVFLNTWCRRWRDSGPIRRGRRIKTASGGYL